MAITRYNLTEFNYQKISNGALCVCVKDSVSIPSAIYSSSSDFVGAGICVEKGSRLYLTINSKQYTFFYDGNRCNTTNNSTGYKLVLGEIEKNLVSRGNVVSTYIGGTTATRSGEGDDTIYTQAGESYGSPHNVYIDNLNARDQFASQALQMLIARTDKNPANLSDDEMAHLSNVAYQWAANMMSAAANARASLKDTTEGLDMADAEIGALDTTTDKLLNNINVALRKTDHEESEGNDKVFSERIINPSMNKMLNEGSAFVSVGDKGLGRNSSHPVYITGQLTGSDTTVNFDTAGLVTATNGIATAVSNKSTVRTVSGSINVGNSLSGTIAIGNSGLGKDSSSPMYIYNTNERTDTELIALIDRRIVEWLSAARITVTSPAGTFDATFDMTFEDFSGLQATLNIHAPSD